MGSKKRSSVDDNEHTAKRTKSPGVRVIGGRIYDSEKGKTCHQCRQKTMDFAASCMNKKGEKLCPIKFCHKCLLNRYGEKAEEVMLKEGWSCPKCRGFCNCSLCMKKKGLKPTGLLVHTAKATGYSSVSEMLRVNGSVALDLDTILIGKVISPRKQASGNQDSVMNSPSKQGKENSLDVDNESNLNSNVKSDIKKSKETKSGRLKEMCNGNSADVKCSKMSSPNKSNLEKTSKKLIEVNGKIDHLHSGKKSPNTREDAKCLTMSSPKKSNLEEINKKQTEANEKIVQHSSEKNSSKKIKDFNCPKINPKKSNLEELFKKQIEANRKNESSKTRTLTDATASDAVKVDDTRSLKKASYYFITTEDRNEEKDCNVHQDMGTTEVVNNIKTKVKENNTLAMSEESLKCTMNIQNDEVGASVSLPLGSRLTSIADIELTMEDVGHVLQFLEFCAAFGKALNLKKGQAESVLKDLMRERRRQCRVYDSVTIRFHIQLLSMILKNVDEDPGISGLANDRTSWLQALRKCISASPFKLNDLPPDYFDGGESCYDKLDFSSKLRLLNYLCDEALNTLELRNWIDEQNSNFVERQKEAREKITALKDKEKQAKHKLQDELAKALIAKKGIPLSIAEHDAIVSQIKSDVAQAHSERLSALEMTSKRRQRSDAIRTDPIILDANGRAFWTLSGFSGKGNILLQDVESWGAASPCEKWSIYEGNQKQELEKYISYLRLKRLRISKLAQTLPTGCGEANV